MGCDKCDAKSEHSAVTETNSIQRSLLHENVFEMRPKASQVKKSQKRSFPDSKQAELERAGKVLKTSRKPE